MPENEATEPEVQVEAEVEVTRERKPRVTQATRERDEAREVIARVAEALGVPGSTDDEVVRAAESASQFASLLVAAADGNPEESPQSVAHRIRSAQHYVRVLRGAV